MRLIKEGEGRILSWTEPIIITNLIVEKININYIKDIVTYLKKREEEPLIIAVISVFEKDESKKDRILKKSIKKLKKEVDAIIIVPNNAKEYFVAEKILENAGEKISSLDKRKGFINIDATDMRFFFRSNTVSIYGFASAEGENRNKAEKKFISSIPEKYRGKISEALLIENTDTQVGVSEHRRIVEYVRKKMEIKDISEILVGVNLESNFKNRVDIIGVFGLKEEAGSRKL